MTVATIVGSGPSLLRLTAADFVPGPVIAVNYSILAVRRLDLTNPIYSMQKDGCDTPHTSAAAVPLACICPKPWMIAPLPTETLLLSAAESGRCFPDHPLRHVFDVERDFGLPWHTMSVPVAVRIVEAMGYSRIRMLAMDAVTRSDTRRVDYRGKVLPGTHGYRVAGKQVNAYAATAGLDIEWVSDAVADRIVAQIGMANHRRSLLNR